MIKKFAFIFFILMILNSCPYRPYHPDEYVELKGYYDFSITVENNDNKAVPDLLVYITDSDGKKISTFGQTEANNYNRLSYATLNVYDPNFTTGTKNIKIIVRDIDGPLNGSYDLTTDKTYVINSNTRYHNTKIEIKKLP